MRVLLSIKPEYAEKILTGEKRFEFRKSAFKNKLVKTVVIYATKPVGKVIGEFEMDGIIAAHPSALWQQTLDFSGITEDFFMKYFDGCDVGYAIKVKKAKRYKKPQDISDFLPHGNAPQFFRYLSQ
jgi:predicted transcriptional regulator